MAAEKGRSAAPAASGGLKRASSSPGATIGTAVEGKGLELAGAFKRSLDGAGEGVEGVGLSEITGFGVLKGSFFPIENAERLMVNRFARDFFMNSL